jgi:hypothetical protein
VQDDDEAIRRARSQHENKKRKGQEKEARRGVDIRPVLRVGFEFFRLRRALRPHELESCPLDHSGIVAASDRNGGFQLNLYPAVPSRLCSLFRLNHTRRPSQKALVVRPRYLLGEIVLSNACSSGILAASDARVTLLFRRA